MVDYFEDRIYTCAWNYVRAGMVYSVEVKGYGFCIRHLDSWDRDEYGAFYSGLAQMIEVAVHAIAGVVVGVLLSIPIGFGIANLLERDPADWRAFLRLRLPRRLPPYPLIVSANLPTASSATIIAPSLRQSSQQPGPHLQELHVNDTRTRGSIVVAM
jgi:hypothetical protein